MHQKAEDTDGRAVGYAGTNVAAKLHPVPGLEGLFELLRSFLHSCYGKFEQKWFKGAYQEKTHAYPFKQPFHLYWLG